MLHKQKHEIYIKHGSSNQYKVPNLMDWSGEESVNAKHPFNPNSVQSPHLEPNPKLLPTVFHYSWMSQRCHKACSWILYSARASSAPVECQYFATLGLPGPLGSGEVYNDPGGGVPGKGKWERQGKSGEEAIIIAKTNYRYIKVKF